MNRESDSPNTIRVIFMIIFIFMIIIIITIMIIIFSLLMKTTYKYYTKRIGWRPCWQENLLFSCCACEFDNIESDTDAVLW